MAAQTRPNFVTDDEEVMKNPYLQSWAVWDGGTLAQSWGLGNAKSLSK
jgi:hypothetical protein